RGSALTRRPERPRDELRRARRSTLALVPLLERRVGPRPLVIPAQPERLLAQHVRLEAPPRLDLEVIERAVDGTQAMRYAGRKVHERAGRDLDRVAFDVDAPSPAECHVAVRRALRIRRRAEMHVIWRGAALVVVHLAGLNRIRRRESAAVGEPHARFGAEATHAAAARILERPQNAAIEEVAGPARQALLDGR